MVDICIKKNSILNKNPNITAYWRKEFWNQVRITEIGDISDNYPSSIKSFIYCEDLDYLSPHFNYYVSCFIFGSYDKINFISDVVDVWDLKLDIYCNVYKKIWNKKDIYEIDMFKIFINYDTNKTYFFFNSKYKQYFTETTLKTDKFYNTNNTHSGYIFYNSTNNSSLDDNTAKLLLNNYYDTCIIQSFKPYNIFDFKKTLKKLYELPEFGDHWETKININESDDLHLLTSYIIKFKE